MSTSSEIMTDYDRLMQANIARVFNERDAAKRILAIRELYAEDAVLNEPQSVAKGHAAISEAVSELLANLPPDVAFTAHGPALGHHGIGRLRWWAGPLGGPAAVNGMDIAHIENDRIQSLHVFIEPGGV